MTYIPGFGNRIKKLRKERNLTQKQLADMLGVVVSAISSYESDIRYPYIDGLIKLANIFKVSTDYLLGLDSERSVDVDGLDEESIDVVTHMIKVLRKGK